MREETCVFYYSNQFSKSKNIKEEFEFWKERNRGIKKEKKRSRREELSIESRNDEFLFIWSKIR